MTEPSVTQEAPDLIGVGAQSIVEGAQRLGLTWNLRLATVTSVSSIDSLNAVYDGDTATIGMTNMTGVPYAFGDRVYVIVVPPSGNFIIGRVGPPGTYCRLYRNASQSITHATNTSIIWDAEDSDVSGMHITNQSIINILSTGRYHIEAKCSWAFNAAGERFMWLNNNSNPILGTGVFQSASATNDVRLQTQVVQQFNAGNQVTVEVFQSSGGNLLIDPFNVSFPQYATEVTVTRLGQS